MTAGVLFDQLADLGANLLIDTLPKYLRGEIQPQPQDEENATYAPRLKKEDGELDFELPATILARRVRAFNPWPGAYQFFEGIRIKIFRAHSEDKERAVVGERYIVDENPAWGTSKGLLVLDEVQAAGKNRVSGEEFLRGARDWISDEETSQ